jgi:uncharacterized protein with FMN-binding domain
MTRVATWFLSTLTVLVLLFGYHTSTSGPATGSSVVATPIRSGSSTSSGGSSSTTDSSTITGPSVDTRWGPVQVAITVSNGKITDVSVPVYPNGNGKDQEINSYALPILIDETIQAQNASIDMVSGATVSSRGYLESLQGAIDQANL